MDSREFLDSLVKSGENVTLVLRSAPNNPIIVNLIWNDEESVGVRFVNEERIENLNSTPMTIVKQKIVLYYKDAIESISNEWESKADVELPF